jgi:hypothetical protein
MALPKHYLVSIHQALRPLCRSTDQRDGDFRALYFVKISDAGSRLKLLLMPIANQFGLDGFRAHPKIKSDFLSYSPSAITRRNSRWRDVSWPSLSKILD